MGKNGQGAAAYVTQREPAGDGSRLVRLVALVNNEPIVELDGRRQRARTCVHLDATMLNREVVIARPDTGEIVILGVVRAVEQEGAPVGKGRPGIAATPLGVEIDGDELILSANSRLTLRCGQAILVLDKSGRVSILGQTVVSHASGVNRIRGGAIQLN